jgi:hypothetical protein
MRGSLRWFRVDPNPEVLEVEPSHAPIVAEDPLGHQLVGLPTSMTRLPSMAIACKH